MNIHKMNPEDIEQVILLENKIFTEPWAKAVFLKDLKNPLYEYLVAKEGSEVVGYLSFFYILPQGEIQRIAVNPEYQGKGIGMKLMENIAYFAKNKGITDITLEVRSGNAAAINLYERCGFVKEGVRKGYYRAPLEDGIIMWHRGI